MTRSTLFDRLNQELEAFGKKAQAALDEGKLQIELLRVRRRRDNAARDLGLLLYQRERGGEAEQRRVDSLMRRLDDLQADIARLEQQARTARQKTSAAGSPGSESPSATVPSDIHDQSTGG
jgi:outer membrane murein-binding lipoprotein Lpp